MVDREDNIWCACFSGKYAVFNGRNWFVDATTFSKEGVAVIKQAPDNKIWIGTSDGIFIND